MFRKFSEWAVAYAIRLGYIKEEEQEEFEKDQKELDNLKTAGTSETSESDLASSGLNDVNADFSKTLIDDEEEKKKRSDALRNALMSGR